MSLNLTREQIIARFPRATETFIQLNLPAGSEPSGPVVKPAVRDEPVAAEKGKTRHAGRVHIRITSVRARLIDADNLCGKYFTDCLRYCGAIQDDSPQFVTIETRQRKAQKGEPHRSVIEIFSGKAE